MGKKGGKGKGGKKKAPKKFNAEEFKALREVILGYQLEVRQKVVKNLEDELLELTEQRTYLTERNTRLKKEQFATFQVLLQQAKDQDVEIEQNQIYNSEHVEGALKRKWEAARQEDLVIEEYLVEIKTKQKQMEDLQELNRVWIEYRDVGSKEDALQVELLEMELRDMKQNYDEMKAHLERQLSAALAAIEERTVEKLAEQKELASAKAIKRMDKKKLMEGRENTWLKSETTTHRAEEVNLEETVKELEETNLRMISELLECQTEDLKIATNFCQHEITDLDTEGELRMNLENMSIYQTECVSPLPPGEEKRCNCATMPRRLNDIRYGNMQQQQQQQPATAATGTRRQDEQINVDVDEELTPLGAAEVKLLHMSGIQKPIHKQPVNKQPSIDEQQRIISKIRPSVYRTFIERQDSV